MSESWKICMQKMRKFRQGKYDDHMSFLIFCSLCSIHYFIIIFLLLQTRCGPCNGMGWTQSSQRQRCSMCQGSGMIRYGA